MFRLLEAEVECPKCKKSFKFMPREDELHRLIPHSAVFHQQERIGYARYDGCEECPEPGCGTQVRVEQTIQVERD